MDLLDPFDLIKGEVPSATLSLLDDFRENGEQNGP